MIPAELQFGVDLDSVRERLKGLEYFLAVEDVETAGRAIEEQNAYPPAIYVSIASEGAEQAQRIGDPSQRVTVVLSALYCEPLARSDRETRDRIDLTRRMVIRRLFQWKPAGAQQAFRYDRSLIRAMGAGLIWGEVLMRTSYRLS